MKPPTTDRNTDSLDCILQEKDKLVPSSGFVGAVMDRVREEAAAPQPIPFPWKRALPGMAIAAAGLVWWAIKLVQASIVEAGVLTLPHLHPAASVTRSIEGAGWGAAALGVSLLSWLLARKMIGRSSLL